MRRLICLVTALALALQASGLAVSAETAEYEYNALATLSTDDRTNIAYDDWDRQEEVTHPPNEIGQTRYTTQFYYDEGDNLRRRDPVLD